MLQNHVSGYRAQSRARAVFCTLTVAFLIILISSMQVSFFAKIQPFGATPDLVLCLVLCIFYLWGKYAGAITGIAAGFVIEALGGGGISVLPVVYMLYGYIGGSYARTVQPKRFIPYLFYLLCGLLLRAGITLFYTCITWDTFIFPDILLYSVLPEAGGTAIAGCAMYFPIKLICRFADRRIKA